MCLGVIQVKLRGKRGDRVIETYIYSPPDNGSEWAIEASLARLTSLTQIGELARRLFIDVRVYEENSVDTRKTSKRRRSSLTDQRTNYR